VFAIEIATRQGWRYRCRGRTLSYHA